MSAEPVIVADADAAASVDVVLRFFREGLGAARDPRAVEELLAADFVDHDPSGEDAGREGVATKLAALWQAIPDALFTAELVIAAGEYVSVRSVLRSAAGTVDFADVYRVVGARIAEHWHVLDTAAMASVLGRASSAAP